MASIGGRIREERERQEMKAGELAERASLTFDKLSKIEHDKRRVSGTEIFRIAGALGVSTDALLYDRPAVMYRGPSDRPKVAAAMAVFDRFIENCLTAESLAWIHADSD